MLKYVLILMGVFVVFQSQLRADFVVSDMQDINELSEQAYTSYGEFQSSTLAQRIGFEASFGNIPPEPLRQICAAAQKSLDAQTEIVHRLRDNIDYISNYNGGDWEERFGKSGIWERLKSCRMELELLSYNLKMWQIVSDIPEGQSRCKLLLKLLSYIDGLDAGADSDFTDTLRLRTMRMLVFSDARFKGDFKAASARVFGRFGQLKNISTGVLLENFLFLQRFRQGLDGAGLQAVELYFGELKKRVDSMGFYDNAVFAFSSAVSGENVPVMGLLSRSSDTARPANNDLIILLQAAYLSRIEDSQMLFDMSVSYAVQDEKRLREVKPALGRIFESGKSDYVTRQTRYAMGKIAVSSDFDTGVNLMLAALGSPAERWQVVSIPQGDIVREVWNATYSALSQRKISPERADGIYGVIQQGEGGLLDEQMTYELAQAIAVYGGPKLFGRLKTIAQRPKHSYYYRANYELAALMYENMDDYSGKKYQEAAEILKKLYSDAKTPTQVKCDAETLYWQMILDADNREEMKRLAEDIQNDDLGCNEYRAAIAAEMFLRINQPLRACSIIASRPANTFRDEQQLLWNVLADTVENYEWLVCCESGTSHPTGADTEGVAAVVKLLGNAETPSQKALIQEAKLLFEGMPAEVLDSLSTNSDETPVEVVRYMARKYEGCKEYRQAALLWGRAAAIRKGQRDNGLYSRARYYQLKDAVMGELDTPENLMHAADVLLADKMFGGFWRARLERLRESIAVGEKHP